MKALLLGIVVSLLAGCAAKNPVLSETQWTAQDPEAGKYAGVVFALPQNRLELVYALERKSFQAGLHTPVVDACRPSGFLVGQTICVALHEMDIKQSLRLSDEDSRFTPDRLCDDDGGPKEARIALAEGAVLNSDFVPDPKEVYVIPLKRSYFQTFDVQLELNANGTIGKGSLSTENLGTKEFLDALVKVAGAYLAPGGAAVAVAATVKAPGHPARNPPRPDANAVMAAAADLAELKRLWRERDEIAARNNDDALASRSVQLAELSARIVRIRAVFTGSVKTAPAGSFNERWIPSSSSLSAQGAGFDVCATKDNQRPRRLELAIRADGEALAPVASGELKNASFGDSRGWPYRVPAERDFEWRICGSYYEGAAEDFVAALKKFADENPAGSEGEPAQPDPEAAKAKKAKPTWSDINSNTCKAVDEKRLFLAQFGQTLRLPEATGGRKSVIAPEYYADGSLKKLVISHVGETPVPIITGAQALLMPRPEAASPSETATLTGQATLIAARQALCRLVFSASVTDPKCLGPNPPTVVPDSP